MIGPEQTVSEQMRERRRTGLIWIAVALILGVTLGATYRIDQRADDTNERLATSDAQVETLTGQVQKNGGIAESAKDAADEANRRLVAAGKPTVPVPTEAPISPATSPPVQSDEFTAEEAAAVRVIVADQINRQKVPITQAEISQIARIAATLVPKPKDGSTPTAAQLQPIITATLAAYCAGDKCLGKTGTDGKPGADGVNGKDGENAPKVTDEELLAASAQALAAYCAQDSKPCTPKDGKDGTDGVGVTDMDCIGTGDDSYWLIYLSNDTTKKVSGPCRIAPLLPTEPPSGNR